MVNHSIQLNAHGVRVMLCAASGDAALDVLPHLASDFEYFLTADIDADCDIRIELINTLTDDSLPSDLKPLGRPLFCANGGRVFGWGARTVCDYGGGAFVITEWRNKTRHFRVIARSAADLHEFSYTALLSALGEALDRRGFHRVHALGLQIEDRAGIVILPSGGGKSAMAALLAQHSDVRLFSDETPLIKENIIYPFPLRMALRPHIAEVLGLPQAERRFKRRGYGEKSLYAFAPDKVAKPSPIDFVMIGKIASTPAIERASTARVMSGLIDAMVVGRGVAQMAEHMLRPSNTLSLLAIGASRLQTAARLVRKSSGYVFEVSADARLNALKLREAPRFF